MAVTSSKAYEYCKSSIRKKTTPKYVKKQMRDWMRIAEGKNAKYFVSEKKVQQIENILKLLIMPKGLKAGQSMYKCATGYQWLIYTAMLCTVYRDKPKKRRYETGLLEICRKNFKALSLDTPIPTPDGWKEMRDISVGDYVFGKHGNPTMVIGESEIFNKPMYLVTFEDGEQIKASCDHIWTVQTRTSRNTAKRNSHHIGNGKIYRTDGWYDTTTEKMADDFARVRRDGKGTEYKYRVPMNGAVQYAEKELLIDPYLLGVWLGDGTSTATNITVSDSDAEEMMQNVSIASGYSVELHKPEKRAGYFKVDKQKNNQIGEESFMYNLRKLNLIGNKHIPKEYLHASVEQRLALLQGIMDTDGTCSKTGQCSFVQKSKELSEQILELINSLGIKATLIKRKSMLDGKEISDIYNITFFADKGTRVFRLNRKFQRQKEHLCDRMKAKSIVNIEKISAVPSKCIMVADKEHLYLAGKHFTPTHNTYTVGTIFIILFLTEPRFSKFFSVAPDGALSREIKEAISDTIKSSPLIYEYKGTKRFKLLRDYIKFKPNENTLIPLAYSNNRMDGRMPNAFIADEVGALPNGYPVEAMRSGQLNVVNKLGFIISTKYPTIDNPFEDEVAYAKKVLDGIEKDDTIFALLYEPDKTSDWETDNLVLKQANPASLEIPEIWDDLVKKRARAIAIENERENFVTKHCNIIYQGQGTETFIDVKDVQACKVADIDWSGRVVYLGVDLSESNDNTSVAMVSVDDDDNILAESFAFIPSDRITEKTISERVNYQELLKSGKVIACGDRVISYAFVEQFILNLESRYNVQIQAIGYDRWNALSTAQKLANEGYNTVQIKQYSSVLHSPTKRMKEAILKQKFKYAENKLLEINYQNAKCAYDTNKNMYVSKKKSNGKVDMVVSLINAIYLLEQDYFLNEGDFTFQMI